MIVCHSSATARQDGQAQVRRTISAQNDAAPFSEIIGQSPAMQELRRMIDIAAGVPWPMLLEGESGTGKGIAARAIHERSVRSRGPFVAVNCAAIPEELVEATLYGYLRGAFTGAVRDQPGKFAEAHRGTLFLDEIGAMSLSAQAKILTTLEDGRVTKVGATGFTVCDVRIIAATSANLPEMTSAGTFRYDLYYRLNTLAATIAPLRERREDIPALARHFTATAARMLQAPELTISQEAIKELQRFQWPGNIRELKSAIWRMAAMVQFERRHQISAADVRLCLPAAAREHGGEVSVSSLPELLVHTSDFHHQRWNHQHFHRIIFSILIFGGYVMPVARISMRKIKEVLRLKHAAHLSHRQIARSLKLSVGVVAKYLAAAERAGLTWPLPDFDG